MCNLINSTIDERFNSLERVPESVFFFTVHKCASVLFASYVLKNVDGLEHRDFARAIYTGNKPDIRYEKRGYVYGPIRLTATGEVYDMVVRPAVQPDFIRKKKIIVFVRDPRDVIVSFYYSDSFSHGLSPVEDIRSRQMERRREVRSMTIDEYALSVVPGINMAYDSLARLVTHSDRLTLLKYEDMIEDFQSFSNKLKIALPLHSGVMESIKQRTRPLGNENQMSHRRSGATRQYISKLLPSTVSELNEKMQAAIKAFSY